MDENPFHYGSHYSSLGSVLFFLIRMRPFTDYALDLQGGHFDHADRIFTSIQRTYTNITTSMTDVKELLPEFYYNPDFLKNRNNILYKKIYVYRERYIYRYIYRYTYILYILYLRRAFWL